MTAQCHGAVLAAAVVVSGRPGCPDSAP